VRTKVCTPARPPVEVARVGVKLGSTVLYGSDGAGGWQPVVATPPVTVRGAAGCVAVN
jgi:hypothetical protein